MRKIKLIYLLLILLALVGCTRGANIEIFRFVTHENKIVVGQQISLNLIMGEYPEDAEVIYSFSKEGIISFEDGLVEGLKVGEVEISATVDKIKYAYTVVIVTKEPIDGLQITPNTKTIYIDQTLQLDVDVFPKHLSTDVTWSIESGSDVATISESGLLTPTRGEKNTTEFSAGGARVRVVATSVEDPNMKSKKDIFVKYRPTTSINVVVPDNKFDFTLEEIDDIEGIQLVSNVLPTTANQAVTYRSTNTEVMLVDETGLITFPENKKAGETTITVRSMDGKAQTLIFRVVSLDVQAPGGKLNFTLDDLDGVESIRLLHSMAPSSANQDLVFTSSDSNIIDVDSTGKLTFPEEKVIGTVDITVSNTYGQSVVLTFTIEDLKLEAPDNKLDFVLEDLEDVESIELIYELLPNNPEEELVFTSSDENIMLVSETGVITFPEEKVAGVVVITLTTSKGHEKSLEFTIVTRVITLSAPDDKLEFDLSELVVGGTIQLTYSIYPEDANLELTFSSSNTEIMSIDEAGLITIGEGLAAGVVEITLTDPDGNSATLEFVITEAEE